MKPHLHPLASIHASALAPADETITHHGASVLIGEAFRAIVAERMEQVQKHGRTIGNDLVYTPEVLPLAAASYLNAAIDQLTSTRATGPDLAAPDPLTWPFSDEAWRPGTIRANLVKANALIWAAIDRIDHAPADASDALPDVECEFCLRASAGTITADDDETFAACLLCITAHRTDPGFFGDKPRDQAAAA